MEVAELLSDVGIEVAIVRCKKWKTTSSMPSLFGSLQNWTSLSWKASLDLYDHTNPAPIICSLWRKQWKSGWCGADGERLSGQRLMLKTCSSILHGSWFGKKSRHMAARTESRSGSAFISAYSEAAVERSGLPSVCLQWYFLMSLSTAKKL